MRSLLAVVTLALLALCCAVATAADLKLIPQPQTVTVSEGAFALGAGLDIQLASPSRADDAFAAGQLREELALCRPALPAGAGGGAVTIGLLSDAPIATALSGVDLSSLADKGDSAYVLRVTPTGIVAAGNAPIGTFYAVQTLKQLIRGNRAENAIPCALILDWPGMEWRGYSDDISRGPIPTMEFFKRQIRTMAEFKMNMLTFYTEHVFRLPKYPFTAPDDGITPEQVAELSAYASKYHVELVGNFQSFGHFWQFLRHEELAPLRETADIITPAKEESYEFLDYVYSQIATSYNSKLFNVNCDETYGLGTGPSKPLADEIGVGGVYVRHVNRIHDILRDNYGKRMMMWGDIALQHPEIVEQVRPDTILLSWGYGAADNYDSAIEPFVKAGLDFMVCPGVSCWSKIFPSYDNAIPNIRNYVRDGAKWGAIGMLNTTWDDDGENLFSWNFYGTNWGGACAWRPQDSDPVAYDDAFAQLNYGTRDSKITRAIALLTDCGKNPLTQYNSDGAFWVRPSGALATTADVVTRQSTSLVDTTRQAIDLLRAAKRDATINSQDIDYLLFAARRLNYIGRARQLMLIAASGYTQAYDKLPDTAPAREALDFAVASAEELQVTVEELRAEYQRLWLLENRPWWLAEMRGRYDLLLRDLDALVKRYADARTEFATTGIAPDPGAVGLLLAETSRRNTRAAFVADSPLPADLKWWDNRWPYRIGLCVDSAAELTDYPVEVKVSFGSYRVAPSSVRVVAVADDGAQQPLLTQYTPSGEAAGTIAFVMPGTVAPAQSRSFVVYFDEAGCAAKPEQSGSPLTARMEGGSVFVENDLYRLRIGNPGAHVFEWFVKALGDRDVTDPSGASWAGFADFGFGDREAPFEFVLESAGPVVVRVRASSAAAGTEKILSFYAGKPYMEVSLSNPVGFYWDYDDTLTFAADKGTPGTAIFSNGHQEPVAAADDKTHAAAGDTIWGAKTRADGFTLANITPGFAANHMTGPGDGWGGAGIEGSPATTHFVTFAGVISGDVSAALNSVASTLDMKAQPKYVLGPVQTR